MNAGLSNLIPLWRENQLSAGDAHMARNGGLVVAAVDDEIMAFGFAADGFVDGCAQKLIALRGAKRGPKIGSVFLAQAHVKRAGAGEPDPVAALAEIMGQGRDEAKPPAGFLDLNIARGPTSLVGNILQRELLKQLRPNY